MLLPNVNIIFRTFFRMMRYEGENAHLVDQNPCAGIRADLKMCLLESDCVKKVIYFLFVRSYVDSYKNINNLPNFEIKNLHFY
jgi:hypothetical protein